MSPLSKAATERLSVVLFFFLFRFFIMYIHHSLSPCASFSLLFSLGLLISCRALAHARTCQRANPRSQVALAFWLSFVRRVVRDALSRSVSARSPLARGNDSSAGARYCSSTCLSILNLFIARGNCEASSQLLDDALIESSLLHAGRQCVSRHSNSAFDNYLLSRRWRRRLESAERNIFVVSCAKLYRYF